MLLLETFSRIWTPIFPAFFANFLTACTIHLSETAVVAGRASTSTFGHQGSTAFIPGKILYTQYSLLISKTLLKTLILFLHNRTLWTFIQAIKISSIFYLKKCLIPTISLVFFCCINAQFTLKRTAIKVINFKITLRGITLSFLLIQRFIVVNQTFLQLEFSTIFDKFRQFSTNWHLKQVLNWYKKTS